MNKGKEEVGGGRNEERRKKKGELNVSATDLILETALLSQSTPSLLLISLRPYLYLERQTWPCPCSFVLQCCFITVGLHPSYPVELQVARGVSRESLLSLNYPCMMAVIYVRSYTVRPTR